VVTDDAAEKQGRQVIFPGVGEASTAMKYLKEVKLDGVIKKIFFKTTRIGYLVWHAIAIQTF